MKTNLSAYQSRILWAIFRRTYGFHKKEDWLSNSQLAELTGLWKQHIHRAIKELKDRNIVTKRGYFLGFNKDYQGWRELPKGVTSHESNRKGLQLEPKGVTKVTKRGPHKRIYNKYILRDSPNPAVSEFLKYFGNRFQEKFGTPYTANFGKEGSLVKRVLKIHPIDRLKELTEKFFSSKDEFIQKSGFTIGVFHSQINKLIIEGRKDLSCSPKDETGKIQGMKAARRREMQAAEAVPCPPDLRPDFIKETEK
jgi:phage replication O-like protein O